MTLAQQQAIAIADAELAAREKRSAASRPARLGAEGGLMAGMVPGAKQAGGVIADVVAEGGLGAAGQVAGLAAGPLAPVAVPVLGAVGGSAGNAIAQMRQIAAGEREKFSVGDNIAAAALAAIPGESLVGAGGKQIARAVGKNVLGGEAALTAQTVLNEGRTPSAQEMAFQAGASGLGVGLGKALDKGVTLSKEAKRAIQNSVADESIALFQKAGYKLDPSKIKPGTVASALEYLGGKQATAAEFAQHNANVTLALAKKALGLDVKDVLNIPAIEGVKKEAYKAYEAVNNVSPRARMALEKYKEANELAHAYHMDAKSPMPGNRYQSKKDAEEWSSKAEIYWKLIENEANRAGKPELVTGLQEAKKRVAKANVVLEAFNEGNGKVSADIIARARENRGALLDGELSIIHKFAQSGLSPGTSDEVQKQGGVIFNRLTTLAAVGATAHYGGVPTAIALAGTALAAPPLARSALSSPSFNRMLTTRNYTPVMGQDLMSLVAQKAASTFSQRDFEALLGGLQKEGKVSKP